MTRPRTICVVTGSRAEFGLLRPVMRAIEEEPRLRLEPIWCGSHREDLAGTFTEVAAEFAESRAAGGVATLSAEAPALLREYGYAAEFTIDAERDDRMAHAARLGCEIVTLAREFERVNPDFVLVLGDQIEQFAAAGAASVGGIRVAHMHGGDRAEGIADEAMRHAITKLAHLHFPATQVSADRIISMGEPERSVFIVGSPAIDELDQFAHLSDRDYEELGSPRIVFLMHPLGRSDKEEARDASQALDACAAIAPTLALHPNYDPGRAGILRAIENSSIIHRTHLPREQFVGLLRRAGVIVGNSSAGLIECAALGVWAINIGPRQHGRERAGNVIDIAQPDPANVREAISVALVRKRFSGPHPFGDGRAGVRSAEILATIDLGDIPLRKRNVY